MSLDKLRAWVGRSQTVEDYAAPFPVRALAATLDTDDPEPHAGDPLPPLWHWLYFLETTPLSATGPDGHARRGEFLPPVPLPRRMWAGSRFRFDGQPICIGDTISRTSTIKSVEPKTGSTGDMVFVTVEHKIAGKAGHALTEEHDIVYREAAKPGEAQRAPKPAPADATWSNSIDATPVLLFRFSALTFNSHRIHYDLPYVTGEEGYPGLIVHGPLLGMVQIELARRANKGRVPLSYEFRALSPVYAGSPFSVHGRREADGTVSTWIATGTRGLAQQGKATFR